jgi:hypothetical protein
MREGTILRVTAADRPYGKFYDFYSVSPENFGSILVYSVDGEKVPQHLAVNGTTPRCHCECISEHQEICS